MRPPPSPARSRTRGHRTTTAPMPVMISRSGRCPWRTSRRRPSSVNLSVWVLSQAATSASTACPNSVLAPLRKTSVSGSENVPGWVSAKTLVSVTAYHSFGGEVEALNTPTIRRLTPSCRHQLSALALGIHRNTITKMLSFSIPPGYRRRERPASRKLGPFMAWIDAILESDRSVHKKQRHTAHRIFERLRDEQGFRGGYTIVREYVAAEMLRTREMFVAFTNRPGHAQADFR